MLQLTASITRSRSALLPHVARWINAMGYSVRVDRWRYTVWQPWSAGRGPSWEALPFAVELYEHRSSLAGTDDPFPSCHADYNECETINVAQQPHLTTTMQALHGLIVARFSGQPLPPFPPASPLPPPRSPDHPMADRPPPLAEHLPTPPAIPPLNAPPPDVPTCVLRPDQLNRACSCQYVWPEQSDMHLQPAAQMPIGGPRLYCALGS